MAIIWVHINPVVVAEGGAAKSAFTAKAKEQIETKLVEHVEKVLPAKQFSTKDANKPKGKPVLIPDREPTTPSRSPPS